MGFILQFQVVRLICMIHIVYVWALACFSGNATKNMDGIVSNSVVYFTNHVPVNTVVGGPDPLKLKKILDMVSATHPAALLCI